MTKKTAKKPIRQTIEESLAQIPDPELGISIVDLGLIYDISVGAGGNVTILMTLTSIGCPLYDQIESTIREAVSQLPGIASVSVNLTFEPPWTPEKMSDSARQQLGFV